MKHTSSRITEFSKPSPELLKAALETIGEPRPSETSIVGFETRTSLAPAAPAGGNSIQWVVGACVLSLLVGVFATFVMFWKQTPDDIAQPAVNAAPVRSVAVSVAPSVTSTPTASVATTAAPLKPAPTMTAKPVKQPKQTTAATVATMEAKPAPPPAKTESVSPPPPPKAVTTNAAPATNFGIGSEEGNK